MYNVEPVQFFFEKVFFLFYFYKEEPRNFVVYKYLFKLPQNDNLFDFIKVRQFQ